MSKRDEPRTPKDADEETARLILRGVPEAFADEIIGRKDSIYTWRSGIAMLPLFCVGLFGVWLGIGVFAIDADRTAAPGAAADAAWMYSANPGPFGAAGIIALIFAAIMGMGWLWNQLAEKVKPFPAPNYAASVLRFDSPGGDFGLTEWMLRRVSRTAAQNARTADEFLLAFAGAQKKFWAIPTLVILLPSLAAIILTHGTYWTAGPQGIVAHSPSSLERLAWSEADRVVTGCNSTSDSEILIFDIYFGNREFDLANDDDLRGDQGARDRQVVARLEKFDAVLPDIPRERWIWLARNPMHPSCLAYWEAAAGENGAARVARLLRVP